MTQKEESLECINELFDGLISLIEDQKISIISKQEYENTMNRLEHLIIFVTKLGTNPDADITTVKACLQELQIIQNM